MVARTTARPSSILEAGFMSLVCTPIGTRAIQESAVCSAGESNGMMLNLLSLVQSLSRVRLFATPWTVAHQASLSITNFKLMSIKSVMPSNHLILCRPLLLLPSIFPSIKVFSKESALLIRWPKYWSFSFSISPSNEYPGLISL